LGPGDPDDPSAPITILGIPSASPAVIERFRNFLRVIVFIGLLTIDWLCGDATTTTAIKHSEILGLQGCEMLRCDDASQTLSKPSLKNAQADKGCDKGFQQSFQLR